jgi:hypothetical protein
MKTAVNALLLIAVVGVLGWLLYTQLISLHESDVPEVVHHRAATNAAAVSSQPASEVSAVAAESTVEEATAETMPVGEPPSDRPLELPPVPPPPPLASKPSEPAPRTLSFPMGQGGVIHGRVVFRGEAPKPGAIKTDADPKCAEWHGDEPLLDETVSVNSDGTLRNVFVYVVSGMEGYEFAPPAEPVTVEQHGCRFEPHVFGMRTGQALVIRNGDDTLHNVHAQPLVAGNKEFNVGQPNKGMESRKTFAVREVMIRFKCDVHPWMSAYVGVLEHPYFGVTGDGGTFQFAGLPAGQYVIAAWHEKYGVLTQPVTLAENEAQAISFAFAP